MSFAGLAIAWKPIFETAGAKNFYLCVKLYGCLSCQDCLRMGDYSTFQSWNGLIEHSFALVLHRFKYTKSPVLRACQRLSLLTSFEETLRHCFPEDRPEHWLSSTEESFVRLESRRDELRKGERGDCCAPGVACSWKLWTMWGSKPSACLQVVSG